MSSTGFRIFFFVFACLLLASLAVIFQDNRWLAAIVLVGLVALIILTPLFEKIRSLTRFGAEFSPERVKVTAEANGQRTSIQGSVQEQMSTQLNETQNALAKAVDDMLANDPSEISQQDVREQVRRAIDEYMSQAQQQAVVAMDLSIERLIFEYFLRGAALYADLLKHLAYVLFGRVDDIAINDTHEYIKPIIEKKQTDRTLAFTQVQGRWVGYLIQSDISPDPSSPSNQTEE